MERMDPSLVKDIIQWDVRTWQRALPSWWPHIEKSQRGTALAIGEREGGIALWLARSGFKVHCTDLNALPDTTKEMHHRHGVEGQLVYEQQDAMALTYPDASFDVVSFKSVIGALANKEAQAKAIGEMYRVLKPGGLLLFAENARGTKLHALMRKATAWSAYWRYLHVPSDLDMFAGFSTVEWRTTGLLAVFGRSEAQRRILATIDRVLVPITPRTWHYVVYGVAQK